MLPAFFIFILLTGVIAEEKYDCDIPIFKACPYEMQHEFPKTTEEFMEFCKSTIEHFECGLAVEEQCQRYPESVAFVTGLFPVLRDACGEDALLHQAIVDNLKCYGELIEEGNRDCHINRPSEETLEQYLTRLDEESLAVADRDTNSTFECLAMLHGMACSVVNIEKKCGTVAMDAMIEIIRRVAVPVSERCGEEISNLLPTMVLLYKLQEEELEDIEQALKKK